MKLWRTMDAVKVWVVKKEVTETVAASTEADAASSWRFSLG